VILTVRNKISNNNITTFDKSEQTDSVGFDVLLDTLQVMLEMIFPANHLIGAKT